jgi:hypothetical protein
VNSHLVRWENANAKLPGEAMLLESTLISIKPPTSRTLEAFQNVFNNKNKVGETAPSLLGSGSSLYDDRNDLIAIAASGDEDRLTSFLRHYCAILFAVSLSYPGVLSFELTEF